MDATRWETEALRSGGAGRSPPPRPRAKNASHPSVVRGDPLAGGSWVTLREAEAATGIPSNTLRKWVRRAGVNSYLESDGETQVRMIDLDAVLARATELGREIQIVDIERIDTVQSEPESDVVEEPRPVEDPSVPSGGETMIVPIDAWNKMLTQLGNLHEAGQQLADARERAAKAETEAEFLRQRLAEIRSGDVAAAAVSVEEMEREDVVSESVQPPTPDASEPATTSYWRYVTTGWRSRKRR